MNAVDTHLSVKSPYPLDEFYIMFNDYLRNWIVSKSDQVQQADIPLSAVDGYELYAKSVDVSVEVIKELAHGSIIDIPAPIMLDMGIKISKSRILVPQEHFIIVRDEHEEEKKSWFKR